MKLKQPEIKSVNKMIYIKFLDRFKRIDDEWTNRQIASTMSSKTKYYFFIELHI